MCEVSIVVPIYNVEDYIQECLVSVANQTFDSLECILVDDKGSDNSMDVVSKFLSSYDGKVRFEIVRHESNRGLSVARNTGVKFSRGKYVYFLDSDDEIKKNTIELLYAEAECRNCDFVLGDIKIIGRNGNEEIQKGKSFLSKNLKNQYSNENISRAYFFNQWYTMAVNKLIKRDFILENTLYFKEGLLHEDILWSLKLASKANSMGVVKEFTYIYKLRSNSIAASLKERNINDMLEILKLSGVVVDENKSNYFLRGKLRSVANFMIRSVVSSGLDGSIKFNFLSKVKKIMLDGGYTANPYLSFSDFFKVVIINLPTKLLYLTINLYLLLKK